MVTTTHRSKQLAARWTAAVLSIGSIAVIAACGSIGTGSSGLNSSSAPAATASGSGASAIPCAEISALRTSLTNLSHTAVNPATAGRLSVELTQIEQEVATLKSQSTGAFSSQVNQLSADLTRIQTDAAALATDPSATNLTNLTNAVSSFKATSKPLIAEIQATCP
jgi:hypothetical protein